MIDRTQWERVLDFGWTDLGKALLSAVIILLATRIQEINDRLSALVIALPLTSLLAMIWMHHGGQSTQRLANHAEATFWFVLPTLPMFLLVPWLLRSGWSFWPALGCGVLVTAACFHLTVAALRGVGINLLP